MPFRSRALDIVRTYATTLPQFDSPDVAERALFADRDALLDILVRAAANSGVTLDYSVESLQRLEDWYFSLFDQDGLSDAGLSEEDLEVAIPIYSAAVAVRHAGARWTIHSDAFINDRRDELAVTRGLLTVTLRTNWSADRWPHHRRPKNARGNLLTREFKRYWSTDRAPT